MLAANYKINKPNGKSYKDDFTKSTEKRKYKKKEIERDGISNEIYKTTKNTI